MKEIERCSGLHIPASRIRTHCPPRRGGDQLSTLDVLQIEKSNSFLSRVIQECIERISNEGTHSRWLNIHRDKLRSNAAIIILDSDGNCVLPWFTVAVLQRQEPHA